MPLDAAGVYSSHRRLDGLLMFYTRGQPLIGQEVRHPTRQGEERFKGFLLLVILVRVLLQGTSLSK